MLRATSTIFFRENRQLHSSLAYFNHNTNSLNTTSPSHQRSYSQGTIMEKFQLPQRLQGSTPSVWNEYITMAIKYKPLNLGQGFPDEAAPDYVTNGLAQVAKDENPLMQQYTRGFGHVRLVNALSQLYSQLVGRDIDAMNEILITCGAYEALFSSLMGHVDQGDEVIIIEPFFDCYEPMVKMAGGIPRFIPLKPNKTDGLISSADWVLDDGELEGMFNSKTKAIILNTPHNPIGKVFSRQELERIAELCRKWNVLVISDEVYEWMVYEDNDHVRINTLPGMWERTLTIGSAGKTFSVTGWKVGWVYGPHNLLKNVQMVHQNNVYTIATPIQEAVARSFEIEIPRLKSPDCYFNSLPRELQVKRDFMSKFLQDGGMKPIIPQGGYFMLADWTPLESKADMNSEKDKYRDYRFTKWMAKNKGLQGIPVSAFYGEINKRLGEDFVRFCFIKSQGNLKKAAELLRKWNH